MATFYFVAGEQVMRFESISVIDAWIKLTNRARRLPIASEYRRLPIEAIDADGASLAVRTWDGWEAAALRDTYGDNYRELLDHAASLGR